MSTSVKQYRTVKSAVRATLAELELDTEDHGASALALRVAAAIDAEKSGRTIAELSGKLLAVLESLGATPAARKALVPKGGTSGDGGQSRSKWDELEARRAARLNGTAAVDAPTS